MFSEKLITLLQTFSKPELNRFRKYLLSPYLNDQPDATRLFEIINESLRKGTGNVADFDKQRIWQQLFPGIPPDELQLRRLASDLTQLTLQFMVAEARQQDPLSEALDMHQLLGKQELKKHQAGVERQIDKYIDASLGKSSQYYYAQFRKHVQNFNQASKTVSTAGYMDRLLPADHYLECFYIVQKLKFYVGWLHYRGFRATDQVLEVIPGFWEYINGSKFADVPIIRVYQKMIACFTEPEQEEHFRKLVSELEQFANDLPEEDLRECYQTAQNYCALKINQGRTEYYSVFFNLIKDTIQWGILLENGQISEGVFKNTVTIGLRVNEFDWVETFIRDYAPYLPSNIRENARSFNLANLYSHQKKYDKVIELLRDVEYSDIVYALGSKLVLLRTYYESDEYLAMDSLIDSFKIYLRRNKVISKGLKREYNNFLIYLKKLSTLNTSNPQAVEKFKKRLQEMPNIVSKKWLLERIEVRSER
ncbi:MAG: hypothetical protein IT262_05530 [Saprospiraceae bacterium]|nr:hypothetical protein [Saprospiraceae bacterium]